MITATATEKETKNYLNAEHGLKSWLLTQDHKRIAILYLIAVSVFFMVGGLMAVLIRLELATPAGDLLDSNTYNKVFTMHGVVMIFFSSSMSEVCPRAHPNLIYATSGSMFSRGTTPFAIRSRPVS